MTTLVLARYCLNTSRAAAFWPSNPYRVHQRLRMAYSDDPRVLFRIEEGEPVTLLVQSHTLPDIDRAFGEFHVLAAPPQVKTFDLSLNESGRYHFRLAANPTVKRDGRRLGLVCQEEQIAWLERKLNDAGAALLGVQVKPWSFQHSEKNPAKDAAAQIHLSVTFEGLLQVRDAQTLCAAVEKGIGSAKAYGFGLLSLARR